MKKKPIAILQNKKKKYYFTNKNELVTYRNLVEFQNLPVVFGDRDNFKNFYNNLKKLDIQLIQSKVFIILSLKDGIC